MVSLSSKLRIREKIGLSSALVGLIFLGVVWQYHLTLLRVLEDQQHLQDIYDTSETYSHGIENQMLQARLAEKDFLITRKEKFVGEETEHLNLVLESAAKLAAIDADTAQAGVEVTALARTYQQRFLAIVEAWQVKGLDENSGLQGAFRDSVHRLQDMAATLQTDDLYLLLLQIRRSEKDLRLRKEAIYRDKVLGLLDGLQQTAEKSNLDADTKSALLLEITTYRDAFTAYAAAILGNDEQLEQRYAGGKGPFRDAAHRIEALIEAHFVPNMERDILQLRRREKDYLLRHHPRYVAMALEELEHIRGEVGKSAIDAAHKTELLQLLADYERDFLALVAQDERIRTLTAEMHAAADDITRLGERTVTEANRALAEKTAELNASSRAKAKLMLWIVLGASLLGAFLSIVIPRRISRPVVRMAGLLDQLAHEEPTERVPTVPGARNEVDAMAESVNAIMDHKAQLIAWWKASMAEADAALAGDKTELAAAQRAKQERLDAMHRELGQHADHIIDATAELRDCGPAVLGIARSARALKGVVDILLGYERTTPSKPST